MMILWDLSLLQVHGVGALAVVTALARTVAVRATEDARCVRWSQVFP
jgi:hypothetical protein